MTLWRKDELLKKWMGIAAAALSVSLLAAAVWTLFPNAPGPLRQAGETVSRPLHRLVSAGSGALAQGRRYLKGMEALQAENQALRQALAQGEAAARAGELAQGENQRLRALLSLDSGEEKLRLTDAWVLARSPDNWRARVTLDKGSERGIQTGQCVIDAQGALVGRVDETGPDWAAVALVTDPGFSLSGQGTVSEALGALEGRLDLMQAGELAFTDLSEGQTGQLGEGVVTFSQGGTYPAGLLVGTVTSQARDPGGLFPTAVVTPAAELEALGQVFVVTGFARGEDAP